MAIGGNSLKVLFPVVCCLIAFVSHQTLAALRVIAGADYAAD
jgi:hypothetical protein